MNNIEVGEYIRTKDGIIAKVTYVDGYMVDTDNEVFDIGSEKMMEIPIESVERIVKNHSKNIIDLIEVGDYVNGFKVDVDFLINELVINVYYEDDDKEWQNIKDIEIKSIVTKQQFEAIEYKIGGYKWKYADLKKQ